MPDDSATSTTRRVSIGRFRTDGGTSARRPRIDGTTCTCITPITDADIAARTIGATTTDDGDDEFCWRCHRPIVED